MRITPIVTGYLSLDGGAMFGVVPKVIWERTNPADEKNRINLAMRVLLVETENRKILIDVGLGFKEDQKFLDLFNVRNTTWLEHSLSEQNLTPQDITDVISTHLHFDHAGGLTSFPNGSNQAVPTFPNAKVFIQKANLENAKNPNRKDRASFISHNFLPIEEAGLFEILDGEEELFKGIRVIPGDNHTHGHQIVRLETSDGILYYVADLIPTKTHIKIPFVMGYDLYPMKSMEQKEALLKRIVKEDASIIFEHDPVIFRSKVRAKGDDFESVDPVSN